MQTQSQYLDYLIDPIIHRVNTHFVLSLENNGHGTSYKRYFIPPVEISDNNLIIDEKNFFDLPVNNDWKTYGNIKK